MSLDSAVFNDWHRPAFVSRRDQTTVAVQYRVVQDTISITAVDWCVKLPPDALLRKSILCWFALYPLSSIFLARLISLYRVSTPVLV